MAKIGIIGGSGLEDPKILENIKELEIRTPYGYTSDKIIKGDLDNSEVFIIPRHGKSHSITPTQVNNKANIYAFKELGVDAIISTTAVGSLKEEIKRGDLIILDQFIDLTRHRSITFHDNFNQGVKHTQMAEPFDQKLRDAIIESASKLNLHVHDKGTVITIEGPRFSTRAESKMFQLLGADVINMSIAPECILANELGIPYSSIAISTDYDSWKKEETPVTWEGVLTIFNKNVEKVKALLIETIKNIN